MLKPNWFDQDFATALEKASPADALEKICKSPRLITAIRDAIKKSDENIANKIMGPSRSQMIRAAISEALMADA